MPFLKCSRKPDTTHPVSSSWKTLIARLTIRIALSSLMSWMGCRAMMDSFSSGPRIISIDWIQGCRPDRAALIVNSKFSPQKKSDWITAHVPTDTGLASLFDDPNKASRVLYAQYWQRKLEENKDVSFPDSLLTVIADETERFSFAYLKEALYGFPLPCLMPYA
jgi:hypothetical protein